jgi:putative cell wall-binding protein
MLAVNASASVVSNRIFGTTRVQTSVAVANAGWTQSDYAVIAYAWDFPDAVSAAPLAYKYKAPILLSDKGSLNEETSSELSSLNVKHVFIVGGTGVISTKVENQIEAKGIDVQRLYGINRYATSVAIARQIGNNGSVVITNGLNPYEAMSISPIAAKLGMPIILTARNNVPDVVKNYIQNNGVTQTYVLGKADGTAEDDGVANSSIFPNPVRITGANLYERNVNIIKMFSSDLNFSKIYLATGKSFADALAGSALAATTSSPIIFVDNNMPQVTQNFISSEANSVTNVCVLGGTGAISDATVQQVQTLLSGSTAPATTTTDVITSATYVPNTGILTINVAAGTTVPATGAVMVNGVANNTYTVNSNVITLTTGSSTTPTSASVTINGVTSTTNTITVQ